MHAILKRRATEHELEQSEREREKRREETVETGRFTSGVKSRTSAGIFNSRTLSVPRPGWLLSSRQRGKAKGEDEEDDEDGCTLYRSGWRRGVRR